MVLAGPPGVGKSRIALAHATRVREEEDPAGGVWVVDCDPARTTDDLLSAIRYTLSLPGDETDTVSTVATQLHRRGSALVVLDNCDAIDGLDRVLVELARSSGVRWLVTTRQRLGPEVQHIDVGPLSKDEALALFVERAAWVRGSGNLSESDSRRLVDALDRNPLALSLAAASSSALSLAASSSSALSLAASSS